MNTFKMSYLHSELSLSLSLSEKTLVLLCTDMDSTSSFGNDNVIRYAPRT